MDEAERVPLSVDWALHGQAPDQRGYRILSCSDGSLSREAFAAIINRFQSGSPQELPQVTIGWVGYGEQAHVVLAIQEHSEAQDWVGRPLLSTRLFCVSYDQLAGRAVDYQALYAAFAELALPADGVLRISVKPMRFKKIAARVTDHAMVTAAMLLTDSRVCLVGGEDLSVAERLRHLDTVAALLPYGMRPKLSASTWTSSTAEHRIRLSFTKHGRDDARSVSWTSTPDTSDLSEDARAYLDLLREAADPGAVVASLAAAAAPLSFKDVPAALEILREAVHPSKPETSGSATPGQVVALLESAAEAAERGWHEQLEGCLRLLAPAATADHNRAARDRYGEVVARRRMLSRQPSLPGELTSRLYEVVLRLACGPELTTAGLRTVLGVEPRPSRRLADALRRMPHEDSVVARLLERHLGRRDRRPGDATTASSLIESVLREPRDRALVEAACEQIAARARQGGDPELATALHEHGYLAEVVENLYPGEREIQITRLKELLTAAYGPTLDQATRDHVTGRPEAIEHPALLTAVSRLSAAPPPRGGFDLPPARFADPSPPRTPSLTAIALGVATVVAAGITVVLYLLL